MKKRMLLSTAIVLMVISLTAPDAPAAPVIRINGYQPAHTVEILTLDDWSSLGIYDQGDVFYTFCMEWNEYFRPGRTYYADISTAAVRGSESIWFIEDEAGGVENSLVTEANKAVADCKWSGFGGVRVLNLWRNYDPQTNTYSGWARCPRPESVEKLRPPDQHLLRLGTRPVGNRQRYPGSERHYAVHNRSFDCQVVAP